MASHSKLVQRSVSSTANCHSAFADSGDNGDEIAIVLVPNNVSVRVCVCVCVCVYR